MKVYKELVLSGSKKNIETFKKNVSLPGSGDWMLIKNKDKEHGVIEFEYSGKKADKALVLLDIDSMDGGKQEDYIKVQNIIPLKKSRLNIGEYNALLDLFRNEIIDPIKNKVQGITESYSDTDVFNPLDYISKEALTKLESFCNSANKSTGATHPRDEKRWFEFISQTVNDDRTFDYETLYRFLKDEEYWGKEDAKGVHGRSAWSDEWAEKLASEYETYVRLLQYYASRNS